MTGPLVQSGSAPLIGLENVVNRAWLVYILALFAAASATARLLKRWNQRSKRLRQIKSHQCEPPKSLDRSPWLFGLDVMYEMITSYDSGSRNKTLVETFRKVGPTFTTNSSDTARIFTIDPVNLKAVFGGSSEDWGVAPVRHEAFRPLFGDGVLNTDGTVWKHSRVLAQKVIDRIYRLYCADLPTIDTHIESLLGLIPRDGAVFDLQPIFYQFTTDVSTRHIFGESIGAMLPGAGGEKGKRFLDDFLYSLKMVGERDEVPRWNHMFGDRKFSRACRNVQLYTTNHLDEALKLMKGSDEWATMANDPTVARNQIINVLAASFDTSAILLTNLFFQLARNPEVYRTLRKEVLAFEGTPDSNTIKNMTYLQSVLNETLRLHGPASFNSRVALQDTVIPNGGGADGNSPVFARKGDIVILSSYALQRNVVVWGDEPELFIPERWEVVKPKHWDFMPFSGGPRVCPGQKLALLQAAFVVFRMVQRISKVTNQDPVMEFIEEYHVATGSKNGALVSVEMA